MILCSPFRKIADWYFDYFTTVSLQILSNVLLATAL
jgi:hypothetical protein